MRPLDPGIAGVGAPVLEAAERRPSTDLGAWIPAQGIAPGVNFEKGLPFHLPYLSIS